MASRGDELYIAVDVGTSSVRTAVVDKGGSIISFSSEEIRIWQPSTNMYEQSSDEVWSCLCTAVRVCCNFRRCVQLFVLHAAKVYRHICRIRNYITI